MGYSDEPNEEAPSNEEGGVDVVYAANASRSGRRIYYWIAGMVVLLVVTVGVVAALVAGGGSSPSPVVSNGAAATPTLSPTREGEKLTAAPTTGMQASLGRLSRTNGAEFDDPESYQSRALEWVEYNYPASMTNKTLPMMDRQIQRYALVCLYYATNKVENAYTDQSFGGFGIVPWNNEKGWLQLDDECQWFGVGCDGEGYVIWIDLETNAMTGSIPHEISLLSESLRILRLDKNFFHNKGDEGLDFIAQLSNLRNFSSQDTFLQYRGLPPQLGRLSLLESLDLSYNVLIGEISEDIFAGQEDPLPNLKYLDISGNSFHASIPRSIARLPSLVAFYAMNSDVTGDASFLLDMKAAREVWLDQNPLLTGSLPSNIDKASELLSFSITNSGLTGKIPSSMGNIQGLKQVWLYYNHLTGNIPSELALLQSLKTLELGGNELTGSMPSEICQNRQTNIINILHADCPPVTCDCCDCCSDCSRKTQGGRQRKLWL